MPEFRELTRRKNNVPIMFCLAGCKPGMRLSRHHLRGGVFYKIRRKELRNAKKRKARKEIW